MLTRADVESGFQAVKFRRQLAKAGDRLTDADFWRDINPDLSITDRPDFDGANYDVPGADTPAFADALRTEGCFLTPSIVPPADVARLRTGIERLAGAGFPAVFLRLYDETYLLYARLRSALAPALGPDPLLMPDAGYVFAVTAGASRVSGWSGLAPHRDAPMPDPGVMSGGLPTVLAVWVALTDVTPRESCLYVVPGDRDPDYRTGTTDVRLDRIPLQSIRAMPAPAGAVLLMSSHLVHWSSHGSPASIAPRMSVSMMLQRPDTPPQDRLLVRFGEPLPFDVRLRLVYRAVRLLLPDVDLPDLPVSTAADRPSS